MLHQETSTTKRRPKAKSLDEATIYAICHLSIFIQIKKEMLHQETSTIKRRPKAKSLDEAKIYDAICYIVKRAASISFFNTI